MSRARSLLILAVVAAGCSGGSEKPGAMFRGPGALALVRAHVAPNAGSLVTYLAVGNERGDELRLVNLNDNSVVPSPGLSFPLSIPTDGRPMWVVSADLNDGLPDALAVIAAGSNTVDFIDTWSGEPRVAAFVDLGTDGEVLAMAPVPLPDAVVDGVTRKAAGIAVALTSGLRVIQVTRGYTDAKTGFHSDGYTPDPVLYQDVPTADLGFEISSLAMGGDASTLYAGSLALANGVTAIDLTTWRVKKDALLNDVKVTTPYPIKAIAPVTFLASNAKDPRRGNAITRVIAAPLESECGADCGLIAIDVDFTAAPPLSLAGTWVPAVTPPAPPKRLTGEVNLTPLALPAPLTSLVAVGRTDTAKTIPVAPGNVASTTTGLAIATATDGGVYFVDLANWYVVSTSAPLTGDGKTGVSTASVQLADTKKSSLGLWRLGGQTLTPVLSDKAADLPARIRVTPGFTPDDEWSLTWQGVLPQLANRGATFTRSGTTSGSLTIPGFDLAALNALMDDSVVITGISSACPEGGEASLSAVPVGDTATLTIPAKSCLLSLADATAVEVVATFRASGLILTGARYGYAGRPDRFLPTTGSPPVPNPSPTDYERAANESKVPATRRLFYVTDDCASETTCDAAWKQAPYVTITGPSGPASDVVNDLAFPFPKGPVLGLLAGFVDPLGLATATEPARDTVLRFTTRSGAAPAARRPIVDGSALASTLPTGLAIRDPGTGSVVVHASYSAGLVTIFSTADAVGTMTVVR